MCLRHMVQPHVPMSHGTATCTCEHKHMYMVQPHVPTSNGAGTCDVGTWCRHMCLRHMVQAHMVVMTHILVAPIVLAKPTANSPTGPHPEREGGRGGHMTWSHDLYVCTVLCKEFFATNSRAFATGSSDATHNSHYSGSLWLV